MTIGAIPSIIFMGPLFLWFLLGLFWDGAYSNGMSFLGTLSFVGMVSFSWFGSFLDDIFIQIYGMASYYIDDATKEVTVAAIEADTVLNGLLVYLSFTELDKSKADTRLDNYGVFKAYPGYEFSLYIDVVLNITGWVFLGIFYDDFQAHIDYVANFAIATEEELLEAETMNCLLENGLVTEERCEEIMSEETKVEDTEADEDAEDAEDIDEEDLDDFEADEEEESI